MLRFPGRRLGAAVFAHAGVSGSAEPGKLILLRNIKEAAELILDRVLELRTWEQLLLRASAPRWPRPPSGSWLHSRAASFGSRNLWAAPQNTEDPANLEPSAPQTQMEAEEPGLTFCRSGRRRVVRDEGPETRAGRA